MIIKLFTFLFPFIYLNLIAIAWGWIFKKSFSRSLAPAIFANTLIALFSAVIFDSVTIGIYIGMIIFALLSFYVFFRRHSDKWSVLGLKNFAYDYFDAGYLFFILFYIFIVISNVDKFYNSWDEFSHWGIFLKETLRLDTLYCKSSVSFAHKDYVPAITIYEAIWCKLSLRLRDADAYRSVQMLMFATILPILTVGTNASISLRNILRLFPRFIVLVLLPTLFDGQTIYHTIYQDLLFGFLIFYCMYLAMSDLSKEEFKFRVGELLLSLVMMLLSKMTALAVFPMVLIFFYVSVLRFNKEILNEKSNKVALVILALFPICVWGGIVKYIRIYAPVSGGQAFSGTHIALVWDVLSHSGKIAWQNDIDKVFWKALFSNEYNGFAGLSYVASVLMVLLAMWLISSVVKETQKKQKLFLDGLWVLIGSGAYILLMYFLYCTSFGKYEAIRLASFERYMASFLVAVVFIGLMIVFENSLYLRQYVRTTVSIVIKGKQKQAEATGTICILLFLLIYTMVNLVTDQAYSRQLLPGKYYGDSQTYRYIEPHMEAINNHTEEDAKIFAVCCIDDGTLGVYLKYYCFPRAIEGQSIGPERFDGDVWSLNYTDEELVKALSDYEYVYFMRTDEEFYKLYSDCFLCESPLQEGVLFRINGIKQKALLLEKQS